MDDERRARTHAWAITRFSPDELRKLRALIQKHDQRLRKLGVVVTREAVLEAVFTEAQTDPGLAAANKRASQLDLAERKQHEAEN